MRQEAEMEEMLQSASFEEVRVQLKTESFWLRLFIRPFCPKPNEHMARIKVTNLRKELASRKDFSEEQMRELSGYMTEREEWYVNRFC